MTEEEIRQDIRDHIKQAVSEQRVMLFMKGTPDMPRCGFSARTVAMLDALGTDYAAMDILPTPSSARSCQSSPDGPRSRSSSSRASWSAVATS